MSDRFFNSDDYFKDIHNEYEEEEEIMDDEEVVEYLGREGIIHVMNIDFAHKELRTHILAKAIEIASKTWFWKLRSETYKLEKIFSIYYQLNILLEIE